MTFGYSLLAAGYSLLAVLVKIKGVNNPPPDLEKIKHKVEVKTIKLKTDEPEASG